MGDRCHLSASRSAVVHAGAGRRSRSPSGWSAREKRKDKNPQLVQWHEPACGLLERGHAPPITNTAPTNSISRTAEEIEVDIPRDADDAGPDDAVLETGYALRRRAARGTKASRLVSGGAVETHPDYSDFTDVQQHWKRHAGSSHPRHRAEGLPTARSLPRTNLDQFGQPRPEPHPDFLTVATAPRCGNPRTGPQKPIPSGKTDRPSATRPKIAKKLTDQILPDENGKRATILPRAGGGTCSR